ncbi:MAG TPA: PHP domain-containing protein, partial [Ignavibacteriaceae bacterium]
MIPINVHSNYTFLSGTIPVELLIQRAKLFNLKSLAISDTNGMYGVVQFAKAAQQNNIKPIIGSLITEPENEKCYVLIIARNNEGYSELCKIITSRKLNNDFSLFKILNSHFRNLIIISPNIELLKSINKTNALFTELITTKKEKNRNRERYEFAKQNNIRCLASNPVYFFNQEDYSLHKTVSAIRLNKNISNIADDEVVDPEFYFKDPKLIEREWKNLSETLQSSEYIAEQCSVNLKLDEYKFPKFDFGLYSSSETFLHEQASKGLHRRFKIVTDKIQKRFDDELTVISEMNFTDYFLIVWDIVREAGRRGMMLIGRGSAANSLIAYCLGITQVDPIQLNLYFERFMNKARSSPPDFDLDFS